MILILQLVLNGSGNKLIFRDFADYRYRGDVFEIVGLVLKKELY